MFTHFSKGDIHMASKYLKKCSLSLIIREMSIKPQWGPLCTHVASLYIYIYSKSVLERIWGNWNPLHCSLKCQMAQPLWETVQRFLKNLNTELHMIQQVHPKELKELYTQKNFKKRNSNRNLYNYLHSIIIHNSQRVEAAQVFLSGQTDKWNVLHMHCEMLFTLQKEGSSDRCCNMDEPWGHYT